MPVILLLLIKKNCRGGSGQSVCSEDSWTTDDEASAAVRGNQMWSMSFEWQDGHAEDTSEAIAQFEETTDFSEHSVDPASEQSSSSESSSACLNGAMKNVKIDYVPRWAMYMEETRWLNSIKAKAAEEPQSR
ncbi:MAG: hypothetical protein FRX49_12949 [Trebouxia sp. A1-2]|nr:MAG: hypothetical protein FRX49_12949 [Trebouxia sp. A1-2]